MNSVGSFIALEDLLNKRVPLSVCLSVCRTRLLQQTAVPLLTLAGFQEVRPLCGQIEAQLAIRPPWRLFSRTDGSLVNEK